VVTLADTLIGLIITQMAHPGACLIIGGTQSIMDMRSMVFAYGAPELSLLGAGITELAEYLGLPAFSAGGCSDSKLLDIQSALEACFSINAATLSGANLVHDVGFLESGMTGSLPQLVLADELISMSRRISRGVLVNKKTLAIQEINKIAHHDGSFADLEHTAALKDFIWTPGLMDRLNEEDWKAAGGDSLQERMQEKTRRILKEHSGARERVPEATRQAIKQILAEAEEAVHEQSAF
jgi:trimethylamine--corrinoid protein Co-methyltransferase